MTATTRALIIAITLGLLLAGVYQVAATGVRLAQCSGEICDQVYPEAFPINALPSQAVAIVDVCNDAGCQSINMGWSNRDPVCINGYCVVGIGSCLAEVSRVPWVQPVTHIDALFAPMPTPVVGEDQITPVECLEWNVYYLPTVQRNRGGE